MLGGRVGRRRHRFGRAELGQRIELAAAQPAAQGLEHLRVPALLAGFLFGGPVTFTLLQKQNLLPKLSSKARQKRLDTKETDRAERERERKLHLFYFVHGPC